MAQPLTYKAPNTDYRPLRAKLYRAITSILTRKKGQSGRAGRCLRVSDLYIGYLFAF